MSDWQPEQYDPRRHAQRIGQPAPWEAQGAPYGQFGQTPPGYQQPPQHQQPQPQYAPQPVAPPAPRQPAPAAAKRKPSARRGCLALVMLAGVIGVIIAVATSGGGGGSFKASVGGYTVINPADLAVVIHVTNTGKAAATPTCTISASDPSGAYTGFDEGTLTAPVPAGRTVTYVDNVTITGQGAQYVTSVTVSC